MKYYFELQCKRVLRMINDLGVNPYVGVVLGAVIFLFMSIIFFKKVAYPQYIYSILALVFIIPLGNNSRNEFLKGTFFKRSYFYIRLLENIISAFPFCLYLSIQRQYQLAILVFAAASLLSLFNKINRPNIVVPSPFSRRPYEFTTGFRRTYVLFLLIFTLTIISIFYKNFNLGIFSLLVLYLVCSSFYSVNDPIFYVWVHAQSPKNFLLQKIKTGLFYSLYLSLIVAIPLFIIWPGKSLWISIVMLIGFLYLVLIILSVFVNYPAPSTVSQKIQVAISMVCPPLLILVIPNLYFQALRRLNVYLK
jgi:hypothetical protein